MRFSVDKLAAKRVPERVQHGILRSGQPVGRQLDPARKMLLVMSATEHYRDKPG